MCGTLVWSCYCVASLSSTRHDPGGPQHHQVWPQCSPNITRVTLMVPSTAGSDQHCILQSLHWTIQPSWPCIVGSVSWAVFWRIPQIDHPKKPKGNIWKGPGIWLTKLSNSLLLPARSCQFASFSSLPSDSPVLHECFLRKVSDLPSKYPF